MVLKNCFAWLLMLVALAGSTAASADFTIAQWHGDYLMNHDGWRGTLRLQPDPAQQGCTTSAWCATQGFYEDSSGQRLPVRVVAMDPSGIRMSFVIEFPGNPQRFDANLFSRSPDLMAGVTYWNNQRFGFYAQRVEAAPRRAPDRVASPAEMKAAYKGAAAKRLPGGVAAVLATPSPGPMTLMMHVQSLDPPEGSPLRVWLDRHAQAVLEDLLSFFPDEPLAKDKILADETTFVEKPECSNKTVLCRIEYRTDRLMALAEAGLSKQ